MAVSPALAAIGTPTKNLSPGGDSALLAIDRPLAGSATTLVFSRQTFYARDTNQSAMADAPYPSGPDILHVRPISGAGGHTLGTVPEDANDYSLVGTTLTAGQRIDDDTSYTNYAYVWDLTSHKRTSLKLPSGAFYLSAGPNGVVFSTETGQIGLATTNGTTTTLATPFGPTTHREVIGGAADDSGVVVTSDTGQIAMIGFTSPYTVTPLTNPYGGSDVVCDQLTTSYAACGKAEPDGEDDQGYDVEQVGLIPLDGGTATVDTTSGCTDPLRMAVAGSTLLWICTVGSKPTYQLYSLAAGATTAQVDSTPTWYTITGAYDQAVLDGSPAQSTLVGATSASDVRPIVGALASPVTVDTFALTSKQILYTDDQQVSSRSKQIESVFSRSLRTSGSTLHVGSAQLIGKTAKNVTGNLVGASSTVQVYATANRNRGGIGTATLHVRRGSKVTTIPNAIAQGMVQVSGNRVLYQDVKKLWDNTVYDAATGKSTLIPKLGSTVGYWNIALDGDHVAYANRHGAIIWQSLTTGHRVVLRKALAHDAGGVSFNVYASGDWVGWNALPVQNELGKALNQIRNVKTMKPAITLKHTLYSLTPAGAILGSNTSTFRTVFIQPGALTEATGFSLRSYTGAVRSLLPIAPYLAGPEISGHVLAWASPSGVLKAKYLRY